jgi:hypothetical protein
MRSSHVAIAFVDEREQLAPGIELALKPPVTYPVPRRMPPLLLVIICGPPPTTVDDTGSRVAAHTTDRPTQRSKEAGDPLVNESP